MVEKKNNPPQNRAIFLAFIPPVKEVTPIKELLGKCRN